MKRTESRVKPADITAVARLVDPDSARILWHVWQHRHARLDELAELVGETSTGNVLLRIMHDINPTAARVLGQPTLVFEKSAMDYHSGERIFHSWWLFSS